MKKYLITLLYAFIFLTANFTSVKTDVYANTNEEEFVEIEAISSSIESDLEEEQKLEQEEIEREKSKVVQTSVAEEQHYTYTPAAITYGTYGRLYVSWYDVALYDYNVNAYSDLSLQQIVDNYDSAAYYASHDRLVIADHDTQGFGVLVYLSEGDTAYIKFADGSSIGYRLIRKEKGYNTGPDLIDTANNSFFDMDSDLIMYTCYDGGIMVTLWSLM